MALGVLRVEDHPELIMGVTPQEVNDWLVDNGYEIRKRKKVIKMKLRDNYYYGFYPQAKNWIYLHRLVWMINFGGIKKGYHVHHKDGNPANNDISNLEMLSCAEHASISKNAKK